MHNLNYKYQLSRMDPRDALYQRIALYTKMATHLRSSDRL